MNEKFFDIDKNPISNNRYLKRIKIKSSSKKKCNARSIQNKRQQVRMFRASRFITDQYSDDSDDLYVKSRDITKKERHSNSIFDLDNSLKNYIPIRKFLKRSFSLQSASSCKFATGPGVNHDSLSLWKLLKSINALISRNESLNCLRAKHRNIINRITDFSIPGEAHLKNDLFFPLNFFDKIIASEQLVGNLLEAIDLFESCWSSEASLLIDNPDYALPEVRSRLQCLNQWKNHLFQFLLAIRLLCNFIFIDNSCPFHCNSSNLSKDVSQFMSIQTCNLITSNLDSVIFKKLFLRSWMLPRILNSPKTVLSDSGELLQENCLTWGNSCDAMLHTRRILQPTLQWAIDESNLPGLYIHHRRAPFIADPIKMEPRKLSPTISEHGQSTKSIPKYVREESQPHLSRSLSPETFGERKKSPRQGVTEAIATTTNSLRNLKISAASSPSGRRRNRSQGKGKPTYADVAKASLPHPGPFIASPVLTTRSRNSSNSAHSVQTIENEISIQRSLSSSISSSSLDVSVSSSNQHSQEPRYTQLSSDGEESTFLDLTDIHGDDCDMMISKPVIIEPYSSNVSSSMNLPSVFPLWLLLMKVPFHMNRVLVETTLKELPCLENKRKFDKLSLEVISHKLTETWTIGLDCLEEHLHNITDLFMLYEKVMRKHYFIDRENSKYPIGNDWFLRMLGEAFQLAGVSEESGDYTIRTLSREYLEDVEFLSTLVYLSGNSISPDQMSNLRTFLKREWNYFSAKVEKYYKLFQKFLLLEDHASALLKHVNSIFKHGMKVFSSIIIDSGFSRLSQLIERPFKHLTEKEFDSKSHLGKVKREISRKRFNSDSLKAISAMSGTLLTMSQYLHQKTHIVPKIMIRFKNSSELDCCQRVMNDLKHQFLLVHQFTQDETTYGNLIPFASLHIGSDQLAQMADHFKQKPTKSINLVTLLTEKDLNCVYGQLTKQLTKAIQRPFLENKKRDQMNREKCAKTDLMLITKLNEESRWNGAYLMKHSKNTKSLLTLFQELINFKRNHLNVSSTKEGVVYYPLLVYNLSENNSPQWNRRSTEKVCIEIFTTRFLKTLLDLSETSLYDVISYRLSPLETDSEVMSREIENQFNRLSKYLNESLEKECERVLTEKREALQRLSRYNLFRILHNLLKAFDLSFTLLKSFIDFFSLTSNLIDETKSSVILEEAIRLSLNWTRLVMAFDQFRGNGKVLRISERGCQFIYEIHQTFLPQDIPNEHYHTLAKCLQGLMPFLIGRSSEKKKKIRQSYKSSLKRKKKKFKSLDPDPETSRVKFSNHDQMLRNIHRLDMSLDAKLRSLNLIGVPINANDAPMKSPGKDYAEKLTFPNNWIKGRIIGRGSYGIVYQAYNRTLHQSMAVKEIVIKNCLESEERSSKAILERSLACRRECRLLASLSHPSLVKLIGAEQVTIDDMVVFRLFTELCTEATLAQAVKRRPDETFVRHVTHDLVSALVYLHHRDIVHRDIKPTNIFLAPSTAVGSQRRVNVKLGDFGSALKMYSSDEMMYDFVGTISYMAPEVAIAQKNSHKTHSSPGYDKACDIWSLGCVILELLVHQRPWHTFSDSDAIFYRLCQSPNPSTVLLSAHAESLSILAKEILESCLQPNPSHRPSAFELTQFRFVLFIRNEF